MATSTTLNVRFHSAETKELFCELFAAQLPITVGRGEHAQMCVPDRWTSRIHCEIDESEGILVVPGGPVRGVEDRAQRADPGAHYCLRPT